VITTYTVQPFLAISKAHTLPIYVESEFCYLICTSSNEKQNKLTPVLLPVMIATLPVKSGIFSNEKFLFAIKAIFRIYLSNKI
jgi:hypothetical protein